MLQWAANLIQRLSWVARAGATWRSARWAPIWWGWTSPGASSPSTKRPPTSSSSTSTSPLWLVCTKDKIDQNKNLKLHFSALILDSSLTGQHNTIDTCVLAKSTCSMLCTSQTSTQKLGRHASRQVRSVWNFLGQISFGLKTFGPKIFSIDFLGELGNFREMPFPPPPLRDLF